MADNATVMVDPEGVRRTEGIDASLIPNIGRLGITAVGVLYVVGVLIVNFDLSRSGFVTLNLLRAEYVLAGALWTFLTLAAWSAQAVVGSSAQHMVTAGASFQNVLALILRVGAYPVVVIFLLHTLSREPTFQYGILLMMFWIVFFNALAISGLVESCHSAFSEEPVTLTTFWRRRPFPGATPTFSFVIFLLSLGLYAEFVFPRMPAKFGGGQRSIVQLLLKSPLDEQLRSLTLPWSCDGRWLGPVSLVTRSDAALVVQPNADTRRLSWHPRTWLTRNPDGPVVEVRNEMVLAVDFLKGDRSTAISACREPGSD
jgi:hypothetical protein